MSGAQLLDWEIKLDKRDDTIKLLEREINGLFHGFQISREQYKLMYELIQRLKEENNQ